MNYSSDPRKITRNIDISVESKEKITFYWKSEFAVSALNIARDLVIIILVCFVPTLYTLAYRCTIKFSLDLIFFPFSSIFFFPSLAFHHFDRLTCADLTSHDFRWMKFIIHKVNNIFGVNAMLSTLDFLSSCALPATVIEVKRENNVLTSKIDFNSSDSHGIESAASSEGNKRWHGDTHNIDQFSSLVPE